MTKAWSLLRCLSIAALALPVATSMTAQDSPAPPVAPQTIPVNVGGAAASVPEYGTTALTYEQVPGAAFTPFVSGSTYSLSSVITGRVLRTSAFPAQYFAAAVRIPSGALLKYLELDACDNTSSTGYVQASLVESDRLGSVTASAPFLLTDGTGCHFFSEDLTSLNLVANNLTKHYWLIAYISAAQGFEVGLAGMVVGYQLQVSPAPAVATFGDVPTSAPFFQYVEALAASGITGGCGGGNYCPNNPVTRGQMAVFLAKALGLQFQ